MATVLNTNPGQTVLLPVEVLDSTNTRVDGYAPTLDFVRNPDGSELIGSTIMTNIDTGLYQVSVAIPSGVNAVGSYIASASWVHPTTSVVQYELFLINVALAFGSAAVYPV